MEMPEFDGAFVTALVSVIGGIVIAYLSFAAKRIEAKNNKEKQGVEALTSAVHEWRSIAERAENKAELAYQEARLAKESAQRSEKDTVRLVDYLRATWRGFINGTVPPPLPIPDHLKHLIHIDDFPWDQDAD